MITRNDDPPAADEAAEAFYDAFYNLCLEHLNEEGMDVLAKWAWDQANKAYSDGYAQGAADAHEAFAPIDWSDEDHCQMMAWMRQEGILK